MGRVPHPAPHLREPLFDGGANIVQVQRWLGHHSPSFTLDTYVHLLPGEGAEPLEIDPEVGRDGNRVATARAGLTRTHRTPRTQKRQLDIEDSELAREAWRSVKRNRVGLSFGYLVEGERVGDDGEVKELIELDVFEITLTSTPANADARVLSAKSHRPIRVARFSV